MVSMSGVGWSEVKGQPVKRTTAKSRGLALPRWLVGSSRMIRCGFRRVSSAKTTRDFCPPDRLLHKSERGQRRQAGVGSRWWRQKYCHKDHTTNTEES